MEDALEKQQPKKIGSDGTEERKTSFMSMNFAQSFFSTFFSRLNLRKLTNLDNKNDVFENNPDMGF